jgi:hypothetical protein
MKKSRDTFAVWSLVAGLALLGGCGESESDSDFGIVGNWELSDNCVIVMDGSRGSLNCTEQWSDPEFGDSETVRYDFNLTLDEDRVELDGTIVSEYVDEFGDTSRTATRLIGTATRSSGRSASGELSALAGEWRFSGTLSDDGGSESASGAVSVFGDSASIRVDGESETYAVTATPDGLGIDGDFLEKL